MFKGHTFPKSVIMQAIIAETGMVPMIKKEQMDSKCLSVYRAFNSLAARSLAKHEFSDHNYTNAIEPFGNKINL